MFCGFKENYGGLGRVNLRSKGVVEVIEMGGGFGYLFLFGFLERSIIGFRGGF